MCSLQANNTLFMSVSFWERESFQSWDYIVVGAGLVGLSTAVHLRQKQPSAEVLVLERGVLPSGASTKNAGFACFGSLTELVADIEKMGEDKCLGLVKKRWDGLQLLRKMTGDTAIDFQQNGGFELISERELDCLASMDKVNRLLSPFFGQNVYREDKSMVAKFGFSSKHIRTIVTNPFEGQLHTGKMIRELYRKATSLGVHVITGCEVQSHTDLNAGAELSVRSIGGANEIVFKARKVAFCTNAFASKYFPQLDIKPGRGLVFVTEPLEKVPFEGVFHMEDGYYYFRNIANRILLGGGRKLDFEGEATTDFGINQMILERLQSLLSEVIVPGSQLAVDQQWSGIMAFGKTKVPIVEKITDDVAVGVRLGGMGVAIGSLVGQELGDLLIG